MHKKIQLFTEIDEYDTQQAEALFRKEPVEEVFAKYESTYGEFFDEVKAREELANALSSVPPELAEYRATKWKQFATMARQKRTESGGAYESSLINNRVKEAMLIQIEDKYPQLTN